MSEKATVLFVDDEERILKSLKILFKSKYNVLTTTDGQEAIAMTKDNDIHVVVSDQRMPIMQGVDVLRAIKEVSPNTMRILLTGYSDLAAIVGSVNDGEIFRYINKPWDRDDLKLTIDKAAEIAVNLSSTTYKSILKSAETEKVSTKHKILVIDDAKETLDIIKEIAQDNYEVKWGASLAQAFAILTEEEITLVISEIKVANEDITLPLKTLKQYHPNTLAIILTSFQDTNALIDLINRGQIYRFLPKPIVKNLLERAVRDAMWHFNFLQKAPQLLERHAVEKSPEPTEKNVSSKLLGYLKSLRDRCAT